MTPDTISDTATLDWRNPDMAGNALDTVLTQQYMTQILQGLNGGNPQAVDSSQDGLITSGEFLLGSNIAFFQDLYQLKSNEC